MTELWRDQRVLVTGGTGFIGSFLVEKLLAEGARLRVPLRSKNCRYLEHLRSEIEWLEGDLRDPEYCRVLTEGIDFVFHLASCRRNVDFHHAHCSDVLTENVRMTLSLVEGLRGRSHVPVVFFSTANIPPTYDILSLLKEKEIDGYVLGKALCELPWFVAGKERGFPLLLVRPVGVYGPRDTFSADGNVIPALIVKAEAADDELIVWGTGEQERMFLYVEDLVDAVLELVAHGAQGVEYVSSPDLVTVRDLSEHIRNLVRPDLKIRFDPLRPSGRRSIPLLPLHECLQSFRWTPLQEGLRRTYAWWKGRVPVSLHG